MPDNLRLAAALDAEGYHCAADLARLRHYDCRAAMSRELERDLAAYLARKAAAR